MPPLKLCFPILSVIDFTYLFMVGYVYMKKFDFQKKVKTGWTGQQSFHKASLQQGVVLITSDPFT